MLSLLKLVVAGILFLAGGCATLGPNFVTTVQDHKTITVETNEALLGTIGEECAATTNPDQLAACDDLLERIRTISRQAIAIEKYVMQNLNEEELALYMRAKWRINP